MPNGFTHGDPVRVVRLGRPLHGWVGRYIQPSPAVEGHAEVGFTAGAGKQLPRLDWLARQDKCPRKIISLNSLEHYSE